MKPKKKELLDKLEEKTNAASAIHDAVGDAEYSTEQKQDLDRIEKEIAAIEGELSPILAREASHQKNIDRVAMIAKARLPIGANEGMDADQLTKAVARGLGAKFARSDEYKAWIKAVAPNGRIPERQKLFAPTVPFDGLSKAFGQKGIVTSGNQGATMLDPMRTAPVIEGFMRELTVRDLLTVIPVTEGDTIEYARMNQFTNNAGTVAESNVSKYTGAAGQVEGRKPESSIGLEKIVDRVRVIAHWITETTKVLMDVPQLEALVEMFLLYGLKEKSESLCVSGDGLGENFLGILHTPYIQEQAFVTDALTSIRKARTKIKTPGRVTPTAILMNPIDWEGLDLAQDANDRYYFGGPTVMGNPRVWGLPVIESEAAPEGIGVVAAWNFGVLYDRMDGTITATNSHEDYFVRNLVAVLAECREGFGVRYTKAFCAVALNNTVVLP